MDNDGGMEVRQNSMLAASEGTAVRRPMLKMGVPLVGDIWSYLALQGRMFNLTEATQGTVLTAAVADATSNVLTIPSLRFTVPTGMTVFPVSFQPRLGSARGHDHRRHDRSVGDGHLHLRRRGARAAELAYG